MKLTQRGQRFYIVKRVPEWAQTVEKRKQVWVALKTDSPKLAKRRAVQAVAELESSWRMKALNGRGIKPSMADLTLAARKVGVQYLPCEDVVELPLAHLLKRLEVVQNSPELVPAVLGTPTPSDPKLSEVLYIYYDLVAVDVSDKGYHQRRIWKNTAKRCIGRLIEVLGDKALAVNTHLKLTPPLQVKVTHPAGGAIYN